MLVGSHSKVRNQINNNSSDVCQ